jgi:ribosomal protection tetracycline resistance protein
LLRTLNLGILAHVDAGKTSLTERLLYRAGVITDIGSVDAGSTQTDTLALERQRGITIKTAVASFPLGGVTVNLIDTPGHPDFIAEVERSLRVLDGAVLVVSAVEGVQPQTRVLMRALRRLRLPVLIFVNKIDRSGADPERVLDDIAAKLNPAVIGMGQVTGAGTRLARFVPAGAGDTGFLGRLASLVADHDDAFLADYLADERAASYPRLRRGLAACSRQGLASPVFFGSAVTGAGTDDLAGAIPELLPVASGDPAGPVAGTVFKVERGAAGEKIAYVRMFGGTVRARDRVRFTRSGPGADGTGASRPAKITGVALAGQAAPDQQLSVAAGQIGKLWGLDGARIGDVLGPVNGHGASAPAPSAGHQFPPPTLETVVVPRDPAGKSALRFALAQLAEQDPLINVRQDGRRQDIVVSLYGEVQKEVIQATLATDFGVEASFQPTTTICIERPVGTGEAAEFIDTPPNPFLATVGLRVEPAAAGSGLAFRLGIELGALPLTFLKAIEETVRLALGQGLRGWQVTDLTVTLTQSGYWPRQSHAHGTFDASMSSTAGDFRHLTPLVLMAALAQAGTQVHEPVSRFRLEVPPGTLGPVLPVLGGLRATWQPPVMQGDSCVLDGEIPAGHVHGLERDLPGLTRGEGVLESEFSHYQPSPGPGPSRPRPDGNPLHREEYLLHVRRGVARRG